MDASDRFLARLQGVADPEQKRKIIGEEFIRVFESEAGKFPNVRLPGPRNSLSRRYRERFVQGWSIGYDQKSS